VEWALKLFSARGHSTGGRSKSVDKTEHNTNSEELYTSKNEHCFMKFEKKWLDKLTTKYKIGSVNMTYLLTS